MRKIFVLFALVFALVTTATATVVTTAVTSDAAFALATRWSLPSCCWRPLRLDRRIGGIPGRR